MRERGSAASQPACMRACLPACLALGGSAGCTADRPGVAGGRQRREHDRLWTQAACSALRCAAPGMPPHAAVAMNATPAQQVAAWASLAEEQRLEALLSAASSRLAQMLLASGSRRRKGGKRQKRGGVGGGRGGAGSCSDEEDGGRGVEESPGQRALLAALTGMQARGSRAAGCLCAQRLQPVCGGVSEVRLADWSSLAGRLLCRG